METRLIDVLQPIKDNDYQLSENQNLSELTTLMLQKIGSPDPVLREELIYMIFSNFIKRDYYNAEQLKNILRSVLNKNYLFYRIKTSNKEENAVFRRSVSVRLISPIMKKHRENQLLSEQEIHRVWDNLKKYMEQEKDHRGYIDGKGWAHAMANAADALYNVASCEEITTQEVRDMLPIIREQFLIDQPYLFDEEERMVTALIAMFDKIEPDERAEWLKTLIYERKGWNDPAEEIIINNSKHFLRALYFRIIEEPSGCNELTSVLEDLLRELRKQEAY
ncbi:DUF2785 domain-containing protein [Halobacillus sp. A1]|uniref:DUF2785 domain-containing protein n=1 Tax=Halobacillus sp. A1 TaxID=2880262 RepID=UPI0020A69A31|nr:DUF2785 domain-containing protein [Halobacillus sp. A1]MCP3032004.1 DUF2785 domain-containing protein [Halobacillus sp. A1]